MKPYDIIVVGGGPAGQFAAAFAAQEGKRVLLLEKNQRCGAKLMITGKGRCNVTHDTSDPRAFSQQFGRQGKSLLTALYAFDVASTIELFKRFGLELKVERGGRVFPAAGKAAEVQKAIDTFVAKSGVDVRTSCKVTDIEISATQVRAVESNQGRFEAQAVIIATGGLSYSQTGCTGDGYRWAEACGHGLIKPQAALVPVMLEEDWTADLSRFNLRNVGVSLVRDGRELERRFGEAFFTRNGIGGPIILDMSAAIRDALAEGPVQLLLDLKPAVSAELFDKRLQRELTEHSNKAFRNALGGLLPKDMIPIFIDLSKIDADKKCHSVSRAERLTLLDLFKKLPLHVTATGGFEKAIVTSGGVSLRDIDMRTMRSKKIENLYFAGEMIDLDAPTGGYNLQLCWSTGYLAGISAAEA